jgi:NADP-dependent 3-hydroxy acid dehydrogenase YdfG
MIAQMPMFGQVAAVTGASRGIGREIARALCGAGASVALLARASDDLSAAADECGSQALAVPCDVADPTSVRAAFSLIGAALGRLDMLVNNAAVCSIYKVAEATDVALLQDLSTNLLGPILCVRAAIPMMIEAGGGDIVSISSEAVRFPMPHLAVYAATKGGLEVFSAGLRSELRPHGIRVSVLRSGNVAGTGITARWAVPDAEAFFAAMKASGAAAETGTGGSPVSVARAVLHILSTPRDVNVDVMELRSM